MRSKFFSILAQHAAFVGLGFALDYVFGLDATMFVAAVALVKVIKLEWEAENA